MPVLAVLAVVAVGAFVFLLVRKPAAAIEPQSEPKPAAQAAPALVYVPQAIGFPIEAHPIISHVAIYDLDGDGLQDVLVCDATFNRVTWIRQFPRGVFTEHVLADDIPAPAHVSVADINNDGKPDLLIASMGMILPNNDRIGKVIVLENLGNCQFRKHILAENIARVTDVRGVDLNGDGRMDLVVGQFGYYQGEIRWMENLGDWKFRSHILLDKPGTIMTPVADYNQDGLPDFAALVSQEFEEVHLFLNLGGGQFSDKILFKGFGDPWASSGLDVCDVNGDGLPDLIYSNGDGIDTGFSKPPPWHGLQWLENRGNGNFLYHRIGDMPGCYSPVGADLNGDGYMDIVTVSGFNEVNDMSSIWMMAWINDGKQNFTPVPIARGWPPHLITVAAGDLDGNGVPVLVTGAFHAFPPYEHMSRVTLWRRK